MLILKRTNSLDADFITLVDLLDADLKVRDGDEDHEFYHQFNAITNIKHCIVIHEADHAIGCGGLKAFDETTMEVKRMYVLPDRRGKGIAAKILSNLETWAKELGFSKCILETGHNQPEALALYKKCGYQIIENYGQYKGVENSVCFEKILYAH
jgi:GNAT superfamily N-acetyltransferase